MTEPGLDRLVLSTLECLVRIGLAFRGCEQLQFGLLQQMVEREGRSGIDLGREVLPCERCSQIFAM